jgi:PAS domain S-box-containing protein
VKIMSEGSSSSKAKGGALPLGSSAPPRTPDSDWAHREKRALAENAPDYLLMLDLEGVVLVANRPLPDLDLAAMIGHKLSSLLPIRFRRDLTECLQRVMDRKIQDRCEVEYRAHSGQAWTLEIRVAPVLTGQSLSSLAVSCSNVTEQRHTIRALKRSEARYRSLVQTQTEFIVRWLPDGTHTFVNDAYCRFFDQPRASILGTSLFQRVHEQDRDRVRAKITSLSTGTPTATDEHRVLTPDGLACWQEWIDHGFFDEDGVLLEIQSVGRDISGRHRAEEQLRQSEERFLLLTGAIADVIWTMDLDQQLTYASPSVWRLLGYRPDELPGVDLGQLLAADSFPLARDTLLEELRFENEVETGLSRTRTLDLELVHKNGTPIWCEVKMTLLRDEKRRPTGILGVARDISSWKDAQEALVESEERLRRAQRLEAVGQLAGGIAHDFNNLLTVIIGNVELMARQLSPRDDLRGQIDEVSKAARRAASLTRQLLAFSRKQMMVPEVLTFNTIVCDMSNMLRRLVGENIELETELDPKLDWVKADPSQLELVLVNLAVNARDAMPDGGRLTIETANVRLDPSFSDGNYEVIEGPYSMLAVTDTGRGIPTHDQSRIFEPFFTTKEVGKGTGLGLSTVYGIVKQSGGYIWVDSEPSKGTRFRIYLPRIDKADTHERPAAELEGQSPGTENILLVEDEDGVRALACKILENSGYHVIAAENGAQALRILDGMQESLHMLLTDVVMPGLSGAKLAEAALAVRPDLKVLFVSGHSDDVLSHHGELDPETNFLEKPFTPDALANKVRQVLDDT